MKMENCMLTATGNILSQAATFKLNAISKHSTSMSPNQSGPICSRNSNFYLMTLKQEHCQNEPASSAQPLRHWMLPNAASRGWPR